MKSQAMFVLAASLSVAASTSAFAARSEAGQNTYRVAHKHHLAYCVQPKIPVGDDRDAGMYVVKPLTEPEYFGHASGSDGAMPQ